MKFHKFTLSLSRLHLELHGLREAWIEARQRVQGGLQRVQYDRHGYDANTTTTTDNSSSIFDNGCSSYNDHNNKKVKFENKKCLSRKIKRKTCQPLQTVS